VATKKLLLKQKLHPPQKKLLKLLKLLKQLPIAAAPVTLAKPTPLPLLPQKLQKLVNNQFLQQNKRLVRFIQKKSEEVIRKTE